MKKLLVKNINSDVKNRKATYVNVFGLDKAIEKSRELSKAAINDLKNIKSKESDLLVELAKYISHREK
jgi:hypothetical protein